jgi:uncharacterized GH25 family protein
MQATHRFSIDTDHFERNLSMRRSAKWAALILFALIVFYSQPAPAHDGWIQVSPIVERGQLVTIALMHGNHSNEHGSFRLAGKWDSKYTKLLVIDPSGKLNDITSSLIDLGEDPEKTGPKGPKGFHLARYTPKNEGVYIVLGRQERIVQQSNGPKLRTMRNARSAFVVLRNPRVAEARNVKRFSRAYSVDSVLEILPVTNPFAVLERDSITLKVLHKGKPAANKTVTIISQVTGAPSAQDLTTDEKGMVHVTVGPPDLYLARAKIDQDSKQTQGQPEKNSYEATYVFSAFNRP